TPGSRAAPRVVGWLVTALLVTVVAGRLQPARACCNVIPTADPTFSAALGSTTRPFAGPGESVEIALRSCDSGSPGLDLTASNQVVTIVFTPPSGARNAVVLAANCSALGSRIATCGGQLGGGTASCVQVDPVGDPLALAVTDAQHLRFRFPDTDPQLLPAGDARTLTGPATIAVTRASDALPCQL